MRGDTAEVIRWLRANEAALVHYATTEHYDTDPPCEDCARALGVIGRHERSRA